MDFPTFSVAGTLARQHKDHGKLPTNVCRLIYRAKDIYRGLTLQYLLLLITLPAGTAVEGTTRIILPWLLITVLTCTDISPYLDKLYVGMA